MSGPGRTTRPTNHSGPLCPADPAHGPLLPSKDASRGWFCPHVAHDGTLGVGGTPPTRFMFTTAEAEGGQVAAQ